MQKQLLFNYIKDRKYYIFLYLFTTCNLIFYFNTISTDLLILFYPVLFSILPLLFFLLIDSIKYIRFSQRLLQNIEGQPIALTPITSEQIIVNDLFTKISVQGNKQYQQLKTNYREHLYFSSHLMHHLKAPLSVIDLVLEDEMDVHEMRTMIKEQTARMNMTVNQALSLVRSDAFEKDLAIGAVELINLVDEVLHEAKAECVQVQIEPTLLCEKPQLLVISDRKWLKVCLEQLVSNAIKYSSPNEGMKNIQIIVKQQDTTILLQIIDNGLGIPAYDQNRIFEPFFTGENGRIATYSSGIGLYLCKKICQQLEHVISFKSEQHKGTIFTLQFKASIKNITNL